MFGKTDKPEEQVDEPVVAAEEIPVIEPVLPMTPSDFNCVPCAGKGLIGDPTDVHSKPCQVCHGTGKV